MCEGRGWGGIVRSTQRRCHRYSQFPGGWEAVAVIQVALETDSVCLFLYNLFSFVLSKYFHFKCNVITL